MPNKLYDFSDPRLYNLHKLLRDVVDNIEIRERFFRSPNEVAKMYNVSENEKEIILRADPKEMFDYGINPYLIHDYRLVALGIGDRPPEIQVVYKEKK
ncbi:hypothetical protein SUSAZ_05375 [Sulfolobus acidocaldarius SUSAZ]|nr:hypothetical protein SUSAZ_05375 [Sulfolobus acidocaldarius SUSAZ]